MNSNLATERRHFSPQFGQQPKPQNIPFEAVCGASL